MMTKIDYIQMELSKLINDTEQGLIKIDKIFKDMYNIQNEIICLTNDEVYYRVPNGLYGKTVLAFIENKTNYSSVIDEIQKEIRTSKHKEKLERALSWVFIFSINEDDFCNLNFGKEILSNFKAAYLILRDIIRNEVSEYE